MRVRCLQHVNFEGPANLCSWAEDAAHEFQVEPVYEGRTLPSLDDFDMLIVMGGPMSTKDEDVYPWLKEEKKFLASAVEAGKKVLGVCFGAQLVAEALGARVFPNRVSEIGWFPVQLTPEGIRYPAFAALPPTLEVFHWHGDTFDLPRGAVRLASSEGCENQAFSVGNDILALQFHLEATGPSVTELIENTPNLESGPFVQTSETMLDSQDKFSRLYSVCTEVLNAFAGNGPLSKVAR